MIASTPSDTPATILVGMPSGLSFTLDGCGLDGTASIGIASMGSGYVGTAGPAIEPAEAGAWPVLDGVEWDIVVS
ncbi:hypothetical protein ACW0JT_03355 [Arthrobacter sp. SA17]